MDIDTRNTMKHKILVFRDIFLKYDTWAQRELLIIISESINNIQNKESDSYKKDENINDQKLATLFSNSTSNLEKKDFNSLSNDKCYLWGTILYNYSSNCKAFESYLDNLLLKYK